VEDLLGLARVRVAWTDGQCSFDARRPAGNEPVPDLGTVTCR
jgi:hypothetical protein